MSMVIDGHEFYTMAEACTVLDVKPATLYTYVSRKLLRSYRRGIGRSRLYRRSEVEGLRAFSQPEPELEGGMVPAQDLDPHQDQDAEQDAGGHASIPTAESWIPYT